MKVKRGGKIFDVVEYVSESQEVCVEDVFDFADKPYKRPVKMWWSLSVCEIVDDTIKRK